MQELLNAEARIIATIHHAADALDRLATDSVADATKRLQESAAACMERIHEALDALRSVTQDALATMERVADTASEETATWEDRFIAVTEAQPPAKPTTPGGKPSTDDDEVIDLGLLEPAPQASVDQRRPALYPVGGKAKRKRTHANNGRH